MLLTIILLIFFFLLNNFKSHDNPLKKEVGNLKIKQREDGDLNYKQTITWGVKDTVINKINSNTKDIIKVAILDSGINKNHPDLKGQVVKEFNAINPQEPVIDKLNHGTAVAGIIAAKDNSIGIKGVAPNVKIYSVKVLNDDGEGTIDNIIRGINWCIDQKVDIMNISFGFKSNNPKLKSIIDEARNSGIIIVASSGNNYIREVDYPARYENVISVGSINKEHQRVRFSPRGKIDFVAPGRGILSTNNKNGYSLFEGTSYSAAFITGLIALYMTDNPEYKLYKNQDELIRLLQDKSLDLGVKGKDNVYGYGLLQFK
ncbi:S8 family peptidase [Parageobacillus sp. VR-IP]|nr:S8 family peptidase [Parageobacillus sp. VR-IP]